MINSFGKNCTCLYLRTGVATLKKIILSQSLFFSEANHVPESMTANPLVFYTV